MPLIPVAQAAVSMPRDPPVRSRCVPAPGSRPLSTSVRRTATACQSHDHARGGVAPAPHGCVATTNDDLVIPAITTTQPWPLPAGPLCTSAMAFETVALCCDHFRGRKLTMYATTSSRSPGAIMRLGIVAWSELCSHTTRARPFMPGMSATAPKLGAMILGDTSPPASTAWHSAHAFFA
jgi:hypothetical protein